MKQVLVSVASALGFLLLFSVMSPPGFAQEKVVTLKYSSFFPALSRVSVLQEQWGKEVEKRTNGRVKVNYFPGGTLTPATQTYDSVVKGIADVGSSFPSFTRGRFPLTEVLDLPLGYKSGYQATKLASEYFKKFKPKEFDDVKIIYLHTSPPCYLFTKKPVNNLEEMKGLKIRSTGTSAKVVQALGGVPVGTAMSESYDVLAKGVAAGLMCPYEPMKAFKLAEVVSYATQYEQAYASVAFVMMNKNKWNSFPPDIQKTIETINEEWVEKQGLLWDELDKEAKDLFVQGGAKVIILTKEENARWSARLRPILDEFVTTMKPKGLPAEEALKFSVDYLKTH